MLIAYNKSTGEIYSKMSNTPNPHLVYENFPTDFRENLAILEAEFEPNDIYNYRIIDNKIVKRPEQEIQELRIYGKILTEEERVNILLQPSRETVQKAENTVEILSTLQEVGLI